MARKVRKRKAKVTPTCKISWKSLRFPGEEAHYWMAVVALIWACIFLAAAGFFATGREYWQWVYLGAWPLGSLLAVNALADRPRRQQLKSLGPQCSVRANNHPQLHRQLAEVCQRLGVGNLPQMCLVEDPAAYIYSMAGGYGTLIVTDTLADLLRPDELAVVLAHEVAHLKFGHLRLDRAITYIRTAQPAVCVLFGPVWFWAILMGEWLDVIEYTADRASVIATEDPRLVTATIVKVAAAADPNAAVTPDEIGAFLESTSDNSLDPREVEHRFKLNRFIEAQPNLHDRIEQVVEFYQSEEGQALLEKLSGGRPRLTPRTGPPKASGDELEAEFIPGEPEPGEL